METVQAEPISESIPDYVREVYETGTIVLFTFFFFVLIFSFAAIPDYGSVMLPQPQPKLSSFNPEGWWVFEKYDGIRAVWHPGNKQV